MAIIDYWNLPEDQRRGMDILIREGLYPPPPPRQPRGPGVQVFQPQGGSIPLPRNWDWTAMESEYPPFPQPPSQGSRPQARPIPKNQITFGDQRLQTPDQFYRSIFPDWQDLSYQYPSPVGGSDSWWGRGQSVRPGGPTAMNRITFGDQWPQPPGQYPSPSGQSDNWWRRGSSSWVDDFLEADPNYRPPYFDPPDPPSQGSRPQARPIPTVDPYPSSAPSYQEAASAARTRQAYAAGMDDYFPGLTGLEPPGKMPNASASAKGFTAGGRIAPGTIAHSLTNLGPVDALFSLGSAPFTYSNYKSLGATNPQALIGTIGTEGGGVFGGLAGARLGATAGSLFGPIGATGGAVLGAVIGGQAGFRLGGKAADELSGLNEANRMRQQQPMYDPQTGQQYMASPPPPTPQERMRNEILSSAQNPYMPYMMAQLGGYYA